MTKSGTVNILKDHCCIAQTNLALFKKGSGEVVSSGLPGKLSLKAEICAWTVLEYWWWWDLCMLRTVVVSVSYEIVRILSPLRLTAASPVLPLKAGRSTPVSSTSSPLLPPSMSSRTCAVTQPALPVHLRPVPSGSGLKCLTLPPESHILSPVLFGHSARGLAL